VRFRVAQQHGLSNALSPFRVVRQSGVEVDWINRFLDQQRVRGVAESTLRSEAVASAFGVCDADATPALGHPLRRSWSLAR
jgi:hypothetical protein